MGGSSNARHMVLTRILELIPDDEGAWRAGRGQYAFGPYFMRYANLRDHGHGWSEDGMFALAFGAMPASDRPGLRWVYDHFIEPDTPLTEQVFDTPISPLQAVYAFANWPIDEAAENPAATWPLAIYDQLHGYVLARNGFAGSDDIVFTGLSRTGPVGYHKNKPVQTVMIGGMGYRIEAGRFSREGIQNFQTLDNAGSCSFTNGQRAYLIDYSGQSGCDGVIISNNSKKISVKPPASAANTIADEDINLSGDWDGGAKIRIKVDGDAMTIRSFNKRKNTWKDTATGSLEGRVLTAKFKKATYKGTINDTADRIDWDNNTTWTKHGAATGWTPQPGDKVKIINHELPAGPVAIILFDAAGEFPAHASNGNDLVIGNQTYVFDGASLSIK